MPWMADDGNSGGVTPAERREALRESKFSAPGVPVVRKVREDVAPSQRQRRTRLAPVGRAKRETGEGVFGQQAAACRILPCCACGAHHSVTHPVDPHHEPPVSQGGRDEDTVPLCRYGCHRRRHDTSAEAFWSSVGITPQEVQESVREWIAAGCPAGNDWEHLRAAEVAA